MKTKKNQEHQGTTAIMKSNKHFKGISKDPSSIARMRLHPTCSQRGIHLESTHYSGSCVFYRKVQLLAKVVEDQKLSVFRVPVACVLLVLLRPAPTQLRSFLRRRQTYNVFSLLKKGIQFFQNCKSKLLVLCLLRPGTIQHHSCSMLAG